MKTAIIKLDPNDDIVSVREKMDWSRSPRILLIYPDSFDFLDRNIDLLLLKRHAQDIGAQVAIVSPDLEIQQNARQTGIPFFQTAAIAQKTPWRRSRFRRTFFDREKPYPTLPELQALTRPVMPGFWHRRAVRIVTFISGILAVIALALFYIPSATITLPDVKQEQTFTISFWANPAITSPLPSGGLPVSEIRVVVESQGQAASSGQITVPDQAASGQVMFTNLTNQAVKVPAGTIVLTSDADQLQFEVLQDVTVPGGANPIAFARVQAVTAGVKGNVQAGAIRAIQGNLGLLLAVDNPNSLQGGQNHVAVSPTAADYAGIRKKLLDGMTQSALQEMKLKLTQDETILPVSVSLTNVVQEIQDPPAGLPSGNASLTIRAEYKAWYFHLNDQNGVEKTILNANLDPGMEEVPGTLTIADVDSPSLVNGTVRWDVRVSRRVRRLWSNQEITSLAIGKSMADAEQVIAKFVGGSQAPGISISPSWWPWLPSLPFRIQVAAR